MLKNEFIQSRRYDTCARHTLLASVPMISGLRARDLGEPIVTWEGCNAVVPKGPKQIS